MCNETIALVKMTNPLRNLYAGAAILSREKPFMQMLLHSRAQ